MRLTRQSALLIALGCGAVAALLAYSYLKRATSTPKAGPPPPVKVIVIHEDLAPDTIIHPQMLAEDSVEADKVPADAVRDLSEIDGAVALSKISAGKPIRRSQIGARTAALGLTFVVPPGMRAVTVSTDPVSGVAGFLKPGNRVDVIATFEVGRETVARTILQDVSLLAIGAEATRAEEAPPQPEATDQKGGPPRPAEKPAPKNADQRIQATATLAVNPVDAQRLIIAATKGKICLALRPANEREYAPVAAIDAYDVIGRRPPEVNAGSAPPNGQTPSSTQPATQPGKPETGPGSQQGASLQAAARSTGPQVEILRGTQRETVTP
jgi:pilus assembly protein CpaB